MNLKCSKCGRIIKTLPLSCGYSISYNEDTNLWGCYMENYGFLPFSEFLCEDCCKNSEK